jgi:hypothetical protein
MTDVLPAEWGASWDGKVLVLAPKLDLGRRLEVRKARFGRSLIDLVAERRTGRTIIKVAHRFGPVVRIRLEWSQPEPIVRVLYGEEELPPGPVSFLVDREHEVQFLTAES